MRRRRPASRRRPLRHSLHSTLMVLRDGQPLAAQAGVMSAEQLVQALDRIASSPAHAAEEQAA